MGWGAGSRRERKREREREEMEGLTEEERRALRGSKFAPLPSLPSSSGSKPRLAHPGGPLATNKAAALAKFLERKLQDPNGLTSIKPELLELAVKNAKDTVNACGSSHSERMVRHVDSFGNSDEESLKVVGEKLESKKTKKKKQKQKQKKKKKKDKVKNNKQKLLKNSGDAVLERSKKKLKL